MKKLMFILGAILFASFILKSCSSKPKEGVFYKLVSDSKQYYFYENGNVSAWDQGKEYYDKSCQCDGNWKMDGSIVVVEGLQNPNCTWMKDRNGRFKISGEELNRE